MLNFQRKHEKSLPDVNKSVQALSFWKFLGPGFLVSVGYMDPGNWATDLAGGSKLGYQLLWVILASNLIAIFLQTLCARLGVAGQIDLAQASRGQFTKPVASLLWILAEVAIIATDVAEVIGSAVALHLLFGIPKVAGVLITGLDVLAILALMKFGFRKLEAIIVTLVATIAICFMINIIWAQPDWQAVAGGLIPRSQPKGEALAIAVGILGATVMPHNLYLHSAIVQTRKFEDTKLAVRSATIDSALALGMAFFVNASILVLAAAVFHKNNIPVDTLEKAHELLKPMLGGAAATLFAVALLASGQSSTITGTLAGQVVMEGFMQWKVTPWLRRALTRGLALIPAVILVSATSGRDVDGLILSQIVLSLQLPFAVFPLVLVTANKEIMGPFVSPKWITVIGLAIGTVISLLNIQLLVEQLGLLPVSLLAIGIITFLFIFRHDSANRVNHD
ncbi:MAG: Nramp family divalent metal transporter [Fimbriimonas sp.]|jgi:manganese transport protein|nr:Nramp family divalent metal transporter [Fimbriimonadaceae bacterium]